VLLITGASQGATSINALMLEHAYSNPDHFNDWQILHLAGHGADEPQHAPYEKSGIRATVLPFLHDMGLAWGAADLAISRAGANSVAEVAINAVPTLFLPYPYHKDMHQRHNAQPLVDMGKPDGPSGAVMETDLIDPAANARHLTPILHSLMRDEPRRRRMREMLRAHVMPDAALAIAKMIA
jgi:UDP-N-acetylglucosamine--N-acetylmuramyl-(pentapeptide) pyrophosphoryl-undecaprenol N-acetylglucosamine transferase